MAYPFFGSASSGFFAQAEVYIAMLPCFGLVTHLVSTFSRKRFGRNASWFWRCAVVASSVFASGATYVLQRMNLFRRWSFRFWLLPRTARHNPSGQLALAHLERAHQLKHRDAFRARLHLLFSSADSPGFPRRQDLAAAVSATISSPAFPSRHGRRARAILGALFFWFPKLFGRRLNEPLGKLTSGLLRRRLLCLHAHALARPDRAFTRFPAPLWLPSPPPVSSIRTFITVAILVTVFAQGLFLINSMEPLPRQKDEECNFWRATTLEWSVPRRRPPKILPERPGGVSWGLRIQRADVGEGFRATAPCAGARCQGRESDNRV